MKVVILSPGKVLAAGLLSVLLMVAGVLGTLALAGVFRPQRAEAYGEEGVGAKRWFFAEGYTGPGFEEWILIYNPEESQGGSGGSVRASVHMFGNAGYIGVYDAPTLQPGQRASININEVAKGLYGYEGDISIVVEEIQPFICERALYFNYKGQITGGSHSLGYQEAAIR
ncbi:MAG: hypothetical protein H5T74_04310 [Actinobacteria bacterium]|nr:hypothetical protein [Actinomycetota bacterium]